VIDSNLGATLERSEGSNNIGEAWGEIVKSEPESSKKPLRRVLCGESDILNVVPAKWSEVSWLYHLYLCNLRIATI
jgi:hypothetical protein